MDEILKIRYRHGEMTIILENFFPSSQKDLKKLLKVIELDEDHKDELIEQATTWISEHIQTYEQMSKECANKYVYHSDFTKYHRKKEGLQKNLKILTEGK